jgi:Uma2 family endonuclease
VREYWIVDPRERRIDVSLLKSARYGEPLVVTTGTLASPTFADLTIDLGDLFRDLE